MSHKTSKITGSSTLFHQPQVMVPPREARCFEVPKGHFFRICCVEGPQVVGRWVAAAVLKKALQLIISYHNNPYPIHILVLDASPLFCWIASLFSLFFNQHMVLRSGAM